MHRGSIMTCFFIALCCLLMVPCSAQETEPDSNKRIVGGTVTSIEKHPHQLALLNRGQLVCGATIISSNWAVTAAHCVVNFSANDLQVRSGSSYHARDGTIHDVVKVIPHERYNGNTIANDIALIKVKQPFKRTKSVSQISLETSEVKEGTIAHVIGWGQTSEMNRHSISDVLREVNMPIIGYDKCNELLQGQITHNNICAGLIGGGRDACMGDSGGPLVANGKLIGVVSWGNGCARKRNPGVYTKISSYRTWIKQHSEV